MREIYSSVSLTSLSVVLSSEEEEDEKQDEEDCGTSCALEGAKDPSRKQSPVQATERKKISEVHIHPSEINSQVQKLGEAAGHGYYCE